MTPAGLVDRYQDFGTNRNNITYYTVMDSYGHLLAIAGHKWEYTFYHWNSKMFYKYLERVFRAIALFAGFLKWVYP